MRFHYNSPEAIKRQNAATLLKNRLDEQMKLLEEMRGGDGRTTKFREKFERSNALEKLIQDGLEIINHLSAEAK